IIYNEIAHKDPPLFLTLLLAALLSIAVAVAAITVAVMAVATIVVVAVATTRVAEDIDYSSRVLNYG
ncbi:MAG: hypothetical protein LUG51_16885, partial [Tannerellaceae bacterium]|nr:hypothetical protein [Tannerellaceae bacterium]